MTTSSTLSSYDDCVELFNRALRSKKGFWIETPDHGSAIHMRVRLHHCRKLLRLQSMEIHSEGDPEYGVSPYENLTVTVKNKIVYIKKYDTLSLPSGEIEASPESGAA